MQQRQASPQKDFTDQDVQQIHGLVGGQENYDNMMSWAAQNVNSGVSIHFGSSQYTAGGEAAAARATLVTKGWTITDGGTA